MTAATYLQPDFTTQDASTYKGSIDASMAVLAEVARHFACHEADPDAPNMTVKVDAGRVMAFGSVVSVAQQTSGTITAPVGNPRIDRVVIDAATGVASIITGTPAGSPTAPAITAGKLPCAQILLQTSSTSITDSMITDERTHVPAASIVAPVTETAATHTLGAATRDLIANRAGTITVTLGAASSYPGREVTVKTIQAQTVVSASSNVVPLIGGAAGTAILAATAGKWARLVSDGTNWVIMEGN